MPAAIAAFAAILAGAALAAALLGLPAAAQEHEHGSASAVIIAHDSNPAGYEFVGNVAHFGILNVGDDTVPDFHQQNHIRVLLNDAVILETTPDSGHDYDGVNLFDVVFPVPGRYSVQALDATGKVLTQFDGTVVDLEPEAAHPAALSLTAPATVAPGQSASYVYSLRGADNRIMEHTDAYFEVSDDMGLLLRTKTHTHADEQRIDYAYMGRAPSFTVTLTAFVAYPGPGVTLVEPVSAETTVNVIADPAPAPVAPGVPIVPDVPMMNAVVQGDAGTYQLIGTYDPWTTVGPSTQMRLTGLVLDRATHATVQHVDFKATLTARATGLALFTSDTLHEYDGIWEFASTQGVGEYMLRLEAIRGDWTSTIDMPFTVIPPALAVLPSGDTVPISSAAPQQFVSVTGLDGLAAGTAFDLGIRIADAAGNPLQHAEVDLQVLDQSRIPVIATKLHTHDSGAYDLRATLPAGTYSLRLHPFPLEPRPTFQFLAAECDAATPAICPLTEIPFVVGDGPGLPPAKETTTQDAARASPAPGLVVMVVLAALALALRQSRRA